MSNLAGSVKLIKYVAAFLLLSIIAASAADKANFRITTPILQPTKFNGIEARAEFTMTPPDVERPLTPQQNEILTQYRELNDNCQGGRPGPETDKACEQRDKIKLGKSGICWGLKKDQSMADMSWHACRVSSYAYEIGSERFSITCRPSESVSISLVIFAPEGLVDKARGQDVVKFSGGNVDADYSFVKMASDDGDRASFNYAFDASGVSLLRDLYDGNSIVFPADSMSLRIAMGSLNEALRDEIAHLYSVCR